MNYGDLHFHSTNSDGILTPDQRIEQIQLLDPDNRYPWALTDHDGYSSNFVIPAREAGIKAIWATEISAHSNELDLSLHVTCYTPYLSEKIRLIVADIIMNRKSKILGQIEKLKNNGFPITEKEFFDWVTSQKMSPAFATNWHLATFLWKHKNPKFDSLLADLTQGKIHSDIQFMKECLREDGDHNHIGYHKTPRYEPEVRDIIGIVEEESGIASIAHPNFSFTKKLNRSYGAKSGEDQIASFEEKIVPVLSSIGVRNYEINALASPKWVATIHRVQKKIGGLITYGSDNHGSNREDSKHGIFGKQNPLLTREIVQPITERLLSFV